MARNRSYMDRIADDLAIAINAHLRDMSDGELESFKRSATRLGTRNCQASTYELRSTFLEGVRGEECRRRNALRADQ